MIRTATLTINDRDLEGKQNIEAGINEGVKKWFY
jgi:hypothetical protein